jgi:hypothetical protein
MFDISADRLSNTGNPGKSVHVRRFLTERMRLKYLDELIFASKETVGEEQEERWVDTRGRGCDKIYYRNRR